MTYRIVVDTNVLISATFWGGYPRQIIELAKESRITLITSVELTREFYTVLGYSKFSSHFSRIRRSVEDIMQEYQQATEPVTPADIPAGIVRDEKDQIVLATAVGGHATHIVSGDRDLTDLSRYEAILILMPNQFIELIETDNS